MKVKAQDLKPGMRVWSDTVPRFMIGIKFVKHIAEAKSAVRRIGEPQAYLPACVFVVGVAFGAEASHTFKIDEDVELVAAS